MTTKIQDGKGTMPEENRDKRGNNGNTYRRITLTSPRGGRWRRCCESEAIWYIERPIRRVSFEIDPLYVYHAVTASQDSD